MQPNLCASEVVARMSHMKITYYEFGHVGIDGRDYDADVIVTADGVRANWWRKQGHRLAIEDLELALAANPEVVVIGSGYFGRMQVPEAVRAYLVGRGIQVEVEKTSRAVERFNALQQESARIVAALHLTC
jgi:hypothetical protein